MRAAIFHKKCNPRWKPGYKLTATSQTQDQLDANEFCIKDMAISNLMEREKCADNAERFVEYVFKKCRDDSAPFTAGAQRRVKSMTEIL